MNKRHRERVKKIRDSAFMNANMIIGQFGWDQDHDLRVRSLSKLIIVLTGLHVAFCSIEKLSEESNEYWSDLKLPRRESDDTKLYIASFGLFIKMGFVASLFSVTESTFRGYLEYLDASQYEKIRRNTGNIIQTVLAQKLAGDYSERLNQINFLRRIRNTLHTNGLFSPQDGEPFSIIYRHKGYDFVPGKRINFVDWNLLLNLSDDIRILLFQIAMDEKVRVHTFIPDPAP